MYLPSRKATAHSAVVLLAMLLTAVVPIFGLHPSVLAGQARVAQDASNDRFMLGIGLSHPSFIEERLGIKGFTIVIEETTYTEGIAIKTRTVVTEMSEKEPPPGTYTVSVELVAAAEGVTARPLSNGTVQGVRWGASGPVLVVGSEEVHPAVGIVRLSAHREQAIAG